MWKSSFLRGILFSSVLPACIYAVEPAWWDDSQTGIFLPGTHPNDHYAPINVGQLKYVATQAKKYLDVQLGLTPHIWELAYASHEGNPFPFAPGPDPENYAPANAGQLKYIASGFYEILNHVVGFSMNGFLDTQGVPAGNRSGSSVVFPWSASVPAGEHLSPANIGQLKLLFSFSLSEVPFSYLDFDNNTLGDPWEITHLGGMGSDPDDDPDEDGILNHEEFLMGTNPHVTDSGPLEFFCVY